MRPQKIRKPLMVSCLILSLFLHVGAFYYFYGSPSKGERKIEELSAAPALVVEEEKAEQPLVFSPPSPPSSLTLTKLKEPESKCQDLGLFTPLFNAEIAFSPPKEPKEEKEFFFAYKSEKHASLDLQPLLCMSELPCDILQEPAEKEEIGTAVCLPTKIEMDLPLSLAFVSLKKLATPPSEEEELPFSEISESTSPQLITPSAVDYLREQWISRSLGSHTPPHLGYYGVPELTDELAWNQEIEAKISYIQDTEQSRYIFSLTLEPGLELVEGPFPQNFYFLIDCSHSIDPQKISRFKKALQRALGALEEKDTFNIVCFGKKVSKLAEKSLPVTPLNLQKAQQFLEEGGVTSGEKNGFFGDFLPTKVTAEEIHSVILISDGQSTLADKNQRSFFFDWLKKTSGNVNVYTAGCGPNNHLPLLDLLAYASGGKMLYCDTNAGFPRKLVRLIKDLHSPMLKNVTAELIPSDSHANLRLCGGKAALGPIFSSEPYTLVGSIDELCDFTLLLQAKNRKGEIYIKKTISLKEGVQGGRAALTKLYTNKELGLLYDKYMETGKLSYLDQAKNLASFGEETRR